MKEGVYEVDAEVERSHWWFRGRRRILARLIEELQVPSDGRVLDVGCGSGANGPVLAAGGRTVIGIDYSEMPFALAGTGERGHVARLRADATRLPFTSESFDLVVALDVLEHIVDDLAAAAELRRVLRPGGALVVFVPALEWLWGLQDEVAYHLRRYHRGELVALLARAGFTVERCTYFNSLLLPPIAAARFAMRLHRPRHLRSESEVGGPLANRLLDAIFALEAPLLTRLDLPLGVSLALTARR